MERSGDDWSHEAASQKAKKLGLKPSNVFWEIITFFRLHFQTNSSLPTMTVIVEELEYDANQIKDALGENFLKRAAHLAGLPWRFK